MTNDEIDEVIGPIVIRECGLSYDMRPLVLGHYRAIFRAGMEAAAKICERTRPINLDGPHAIICRPADPIECAANIRRAAANAPPAP